MSRVLLAVNTLTAVNNQVYASHMNLAFRLGRDTEDEFILFNGYRRAIDNFRNQAGKFAIQLECDYLWFLDDDVLVPRNVYQQLKERDKDVITPHVYIRGYPFEPMFFISKNGSGDYVEMSNYRNWEEVVKKTQDPLIEVSSIGFSCCLIKTDVLKKIPEPWFVTGQNHTEDVYFCIKARQELKNEISIYVDTSLFTGHLLEPEFITIQNRDALRSFYEELNPNLKEMKKDECSGECSSIEGKSPNGANECTIGGSS